MKRDYKTLFFSGLALLTLALFSCALCRCSSCGVSNRPVISKDDMSKILSDMYLANQWAAADPERSAKADTTLLYEAVFQRYGYTFDDFNSSMEIYIRKPNAYKKIFKTADEILKEGAKRAAIEYKSEDYKLETVIDIPLRNTADTSLFGKWWLYRKTIGKSDTLVVKIPFSVSYTRAKTSERAILSDVRKGGNAPFERPRVKR